ncbi:ABC transporter substrate-binding protein [Phenylobacterium immobile]|uniref:ABC transporter substrate-binding protein n=1 Tax=Phenylobacterium immobile TaxID=21 RepID=UPI000B24022D|nr:ABC transporter substrate-binding protein [Phenylobacterium immobile]
MTLKALVIAASLALAPVAQAAPRVLSWDQCADQYVLALSPRSAIVGLSTRADDADSRLRALVRGLPQRRVSLETALAARPEVVVRYWGGDPRLVRAVTARGAKVVQIDEATDFAGVRANIRKVAAALRRSAAGEAVIADMDARLAHAAGAWGGLRGLYLTPGGVTAGSGTLVGAIMAAAGMANAETRSGFQALSLEQMALNPPGAVVLGFFDTVQATDAWAVGRHAVVRRIAHRRTVANLPGALLGCPEAGAALAAERLAAQARP